MTTDIKQKEERMSKLTNTERLSLLSLIDHGLWTKASNTPVASELFGSLWNLIDTTISGSRVSKLLPKTSDEGFSVIEITGNNGENLGRLNMLSIEEPVLCYYLVYVEVAPLFRKKGLGTLILNHLKAHLDEREAIGILDNIIPVDDPSYSIYFKTGWEPISNIAGKTDSSNCGNYMVYIPHGRKGDNLEKAVGELLTHLVKQRPTIDMKDNQEMVGRTIEEFKELHTALSTYFEHEIRENEPSKFMRYLFTRFANQVITFRRHIGELIGYTGGESMEQIELKPEVAKLQVQWIAPKETAHNDFGLWGDKPLCLHLLSLWKDQPAKAIESLPIHPEPKTKRFFENQKATVPGPTIGDLMELGFDPTAFREFEINGEKYTFERVQLRKMKDIEKKQAMVETLGPKLKGRKFRGSNLKLNPPLLLLQDRGNAYLMRKRIEAIHFEDALEQLDSSPRLRNLRASMGLDKLILNTVREANGALSELEDADRTTALQDFAWFIPWDFEQNEPRLFIDYSGPSLEAVWLL